jgi:hypothetical protein
MIFAQNNHLDPETSQKNGDFDLLRFMRARGIANTSKQCSHF